MLTDEGVIYSWSSKPVCYLELSELRWGVASTSRIFILNISPIILKFLNDWLHARDDNLELSKMAGDRTMTSASLDVFAALRQVTAGVLV